MNAYIYAFWRSRIAVVKANILRGKFRSQSEMVAMKPEEDTKQRRSQLHDYSICTFNGKSQEAR